MNVYHMVHINAYIFLLVLFLRKALTNVVVLGLSLRGLLSQNTIGWVDYTADLYFLTVLEAGSLRSGYQHGGVLVRSPALSCRQPPSHSVLT